MDIPNEKFISDDKLNHLEVLLQNAWPAPWTHHTFDISCPCENAEDCDNCPGEQDGQTCAEVEAREAYPYSHKDPAQEGCGQCVVQINVPGLESFAARNAEFIAEMRNMLPAILAELRIRRRGGTE